MATSAPAAARRLTRKEVRENSAIGSDDMSALEALSRLRWDRSNGLDRRAIRIGVALLTLEGPATCRSVYRSAHSCKYGDGCRYGHTVQPLAEAVDIGMHIRSEGDVDSATIIRETDFNSFTRLEAAGRLSPSQVMFITYRGGCLWNAFSRDQRLWDSVVAPVPDDASLLLGFTMPEELPYLSALPGNALSTMVDFLDDASLAALCALSNEMLLSLADATIWLRRLEALPAFRAATLTGRVVPGVSWLPEMTAHKLGVLETAGSAAFPPRAFTVVYPSPRKPAAGVILSSCDAEGALSGTASSERIRTVGEVRRGRGTDSSQPLSGVPTCSFGRLSLLRVLGSEPLSTASAHQLRGLWLSLSRTTNWGHAVRFQSELQALRAVKVDEGMQHLLDAMPDTGPPTPRLPLQIAREFAALGPASESSSDSPAIGGGSGERSRGGGSSSPRVASRSTHIAPAPTSPSKGNEERRIGDGGAGGSHLSALSPAELSVVRAIESHARKHSQDEGAAHAYSQPNPNPARRGGERRGEGAPSGISRLSTGTSGNGSGGGGGRQSGAVTGGNSLAIGREAPHALRSGRVTAPPPLRRLLEQLRAGRSLADESYSTQHSRERWTAACRSEMLGVLSLLVHPPPPPLSAHAAGETLLDLMEVGTGAIADLSLEHELPATAAVILSGGAGVGATGSEVEGEVPPARALEALLIGALANPTPAPIPPAPAGSPSSLRSNSATVESVPARGIETPATPPTHAHHNDFSPASSLFVATAGTQVRDCTGMEFTFPTSGEDSGAPRSHKSVSGGGGGTTVGTVGVTSALGVVRGGVPVSSSVGPSACPIRCVAISEGRVASVDRAGAIRVHAADGTRIAAGKATGLTSSSYSSLGLGTAPGLDHCGVVCGMDFNEDMVATGHPDGSVIISVLGSGQAMRAGAALRFDDSLLAPAGSLSASHSSTTGRSRSGSSQALTHTTLRFMDHGAQILVGRKVLRSSGALRLGGCLTLYSTETGELIRNMSCPYEEALLRGESPSLPTVVTAMSDTTALVGYSDGTTRVWDTRVFREVAVMRVKSDPVRTLIATTFLHPQTLTSPTSSSAAQWMDHTGMEARAEEEEEEGSPDSASMSEAAANALVDTSGLHVPGTTSLPWYRDVIDAECSIQHLACRDFQVLDSRASPVMPTIGDPAAVFTPLSSPFVRTWDLRASLSQPFHVIDLGPKCLRTVAGVAFDAERVLIAHQHLARRAARMAFDERGVEDGDAPPPAPMFHWNHRDRAPVGGRAAQPVRRMLSRLLWHQMHQSDLYLPLIPEYAWPAGHAPPKSLVRGGTSYSRTSSGAGKVPGVLWGEYDSYGYRVSVPTCHSSQFALGRASESLSGGGSGTKVSATADASAGEHAHNDEEEGEAGEGVEAGDEGVGILQHPTRLAGMCALTVWHPHTFSMAAHIPLPSVHCLGASQAMLAVGTDEQLMYWHTSKTSQLRGRRVSTSSATGSSPAMLSFTGRPSSGSGESPKAGGAHSKQRASRRKSAASGGNGPPSGSREARERPAAPKARSLRHQAALAAAATAALGRPAGPSASALSEVDLVDSISYMSPSDSDSDTDSD